MDVTKFNHELVCSVSVSSHENHNIMTKSHNEETFNPQVMQLHLGKSSSKWKTEEAVQRGKSGGLGLSKNSRVFTFSIYRNWH